MGHAEKRAGLSLEICGRGAVRGLLQMVGQQPRRTVDCNEATASSRRSCLLHDAESEQSRAMHVNSGGTPLTCKNPSRHLQQCSGVYSHPCNAQ